ncbi:hypothetical protein GCM10010315_10010 [Streptomyces luteosporeus]|uniref:non-specific serine/threonine protein kinase n=1 Tax=Streptomyces luteosporeus TaxID=173856 RepID=A0ABN3TNW4_9ACTN
MGDDLPPELAQRFDREAVAAAQINHPNVASLYDYGRHEDLLFLVMEKVDGGSLSEHLRTRPVFAPAAALALAEAICAALAAAHAAGVVHYDIKPHNVMLTPDRQVKVVDFGIAGFLHTAFTLAHSSQLTPAGTPEYGAPEQFLAERGDARSDLYALGGLLFVMLAGQAPFTGPNAMAVVRRKLDEDPPRLDTLRSDLPTALTDLVARLLARDPVQRPQTAAEVLRRIRDLQAATGSGSVPATVPVPTVPGTVGEEDEVRLTWSGEEPLKTYVRLQKMWPYWVVFLASSAVLAVLIPIFLRAYQADPYNEAQTGIFIAVGMVPFAAVLVCLIAIPNGTFIRARDARARRPRSTWSLIVDGEGITVTSEVGSETFPWPTLDRVAIKVLVCRNYDYKAPIDHYTGLFLDLDPTAPPHSLQRPAGWHYRAGYLRMDPRTNVPVCVLGPMTERQRSQLVRSLITYAGPAWDPETTFITQPVDQ